MKPKFKLKFGAVKHGWFPITFTTNETEIYIDASDVPIDPVLELIKAVEGAFLYQTESEAWFSLEPYYYQMIFKPIKNSIKIEIFYVDENGASLQRRKEKMFEYIGNANALLLQFWRGLKELSSKEQQYLSQLSRIEDAIQKANRSAQDI